MCYTNSKAHIFLEDEKIGYILINKGDANKNNKLDIGDILTIQRYIAAKNDEEIAKKHPDWLKL